ncbi:hypothetical protein D3C78_1614140 [compost metagenome]
MLNLRPVIFTGLYGGMMNWDIGAMKYGRIASIKVHIWQRDYKTVFRKCGPLTVFCRLYHLSDAFAGDYQVGRFFRFFFI